ncbi:MAG TPA: sugar ABC transporter permease [Chloroflexota bacterium]|nr:sugar ABC transporter permease [Chloroflexota bacterium]
MVTGARPRPTIVSAKRRGISDSTISFWILVGPMVLGLFVFVVVPIAWGFLISFFNARNTIALTSFAGLSNYAAVLGDSTFIASLRTIIVFAIFIVPLTFAVSLTLALLVHRSRWGKGFFQTTLFLPTACSYVIAALIWRMSIFNSLPYGLANLLLNLVAAGPITWIGTADPPWYWLVLVTVRLWLQVGFYMILFIAGLQDIPSHIYDAARVDGTNGGWAMFRHITFPLLRNTSIFVLFVNIIAAFQAFDEFYNVLSGGGTSAAGGNLALARTPLIYLYQIAFSDQNFGRGAAGAFVLTAIVVFVTLLQGKVLGFGGSSE